MTVRETTKALERALEIVKSSVTTSGFAPIDCYHADYGWIVKNGKLTESGLLFYKKYWEVAQW